MAGLLVRCVLALGLVPAPGAAAELVMVFSGAGPAGPIRAMLFADAEAFAARERPVAAVVLTPRDGVARASIGELPPGTYAVAAYQDVNGNQRLDTTWLGAPAEPYGFSRDPGAVSAPPDYATVSVALPEAGLMVSIGLR